MCSKAQYGGKGNPLEFSIKLGLMDYRAADYGSQPFYSRTVAGTDHA
jgi:hypothetical protein